MSDTVAYPEIMRDEDEVVALSTEQDGIGYDEPPALPERMTDTEIEAEVARMLQDAVTHVDGSLGPARAQATDYYNMRPFGDEEEGRSQFVSSDVRDAVGGILPSLMRLFFGPERVVEFGPRHAGDEDSARQKTDYINYIIEVDNNGFLEVYNAIKDALIRRTGIIKWWWDDSMMREEHTLTGLTEDQLIILEADSEVELTITGQYEWIDPRQILQYTKMLQQYRAYMEQGVSLEQLGPPPERPMPVTLYDANVVRYNQTGRIHISAVPNEELAYSSDARDLSSSRIVVHRRDLPKSVLIGVHGVPEELLVGAGSSGGSVTELKSNEEAIARAANKDLRTSERAKDDDDYPYYECYVYMNIDNDPESVSAHYKVRLVGTGMKLVDYERFPERPFAIFRIDPEPHTMDGLSAADRTMDIQLAKSKMIRGIQDSMAFSLHPRTAIVDGQVNLQDVLNTEIGSVIRQRAPGMIQELTHDFNGASAFPFLGYFDEMKENRLGISKAAAGLDPDALQSSTRAAVAATVTGAQQHVDLFARLLMETGMKPLMKGLLKMVVEKQSFQRTVRLRDTFVQVDPRVWDANMDVIVNVAVGFTLTEERLAALARILEKQEQILANMGPANPFVTFGQYAQALQRFTVLSGYRDYTRFWNDLPLEFNPEPPPPQPSPEEKLADAQVAKVQSDSAIDQRKLQLEEMKARMQDQRERDRIEAELFLRAKEIELKYQLQERKIQNELQTKLASLNTGDTNDAG